jgi:hypothetical protein
MMGSSKAGKQSKNNPDLKVKKKENKIMSVVDCEKTCKEFCKEYYEYCKKLENGKILKGLVCRK